MNLFKFLNRGAAHAPSEAERRQAAIAKSAEYARDRWLDALLTDQTRAWWSIGEQDKQVLSGTVVMLTIAGFCEVFDTKSAETVDLRVLRGGISAATQCGAAGSVITVPLAQAISSACLRAEAIIRRATVPGILHAAQTIRATVGLSELAAPGALYAAGCAAASFPVVQA